MLKKRVISGSVLGVLFIVTSIWLPSIWILPILLFISALGQREFYTMVNMSGIPAFKVLGTICGAALISVTYFGIVHTVEGYDIYFLEQLVLLCSLIIVFVRQFPQKNNPRPLETIACTIFGVCYVPFLLNFFTRIMFEWDKISLHDKLGETGRVLLLYVVIVVKISDISALLTGGTIGRHKLFPRLSPSKTWEGLFGGITGSVLASLFFYKISGGFLGKIQINFYDAFLIPLILGSVGVVGDLFESLLKRAAGAKDSGNIFPGMGGLLDVLDSLLFSVPVFYLYLKFFAG